MGRKALFGLSLRLSCGPVWDFSDSLSTHSGDYQALGVEESKRNSIPILGMPARDMVG